MTNWFPPSLERILFDEFLPMALFSPHLFDASVGVPMKNVWFVAGREGNMKGPTLRDACINLQASLQPKRDAFDFYYFDISQNDPTHLTYVKDIAERIEESPTKDTHSRTGRVLIVEHADRLASSRDDTAAVMFNDLPRQARGHHVVLLLCIDVTVSRLPIPTRIAYQYERQVLFPGPPNDDAWKVSYFKARFSAYARFIAQNEMRNFVTVALTDDDYEMMAECAPYATMEELDGYCSAVIQSVHMVTRERAKRTIDTQCCRDAMKDKGGVLVLTLSDGYAAEQEFLSSAGIKGIPALPERTDRTITNKAVYDNGGFELPNAIKMDEPFRYTFDKDGNEQPINEFNKRPREDP